MAISNPAITGRARPAAAGQQTQPTSGEQGRCTGWHLARLWLGCLLAAGSYGLTLLLPAWVKTAGGSQAQAGLVYWCGGIGAACALVLGGRLAERIGPARGAVAGCWLYAAGTGILATVTRPGGGAYAAGVLLGAGWALFFTCAPLTASRLPGARRGSGRFQVLAGCNALSMGTAPIVGQFLVDNGASYRSLFAAAALLSLGAGALLSALARLVPTAPAQAPAGTAGPGIAGPARLVLTSRARPFLVMVLLGACVFTAMTTYQATLAARMGLDPAVFYACYTAGVIIPRFTLTRVLATVSPARATTTLLAGMSVALAGFLLAGHNPAIYAASSTALGISYGLAYPLIQAQAADSAPAGLRHWALWYFSLAYFTGLYGFPLLASTLIGIGGYQALITCLLAIAALELAVSATTRPTKPVQGDVDRRRARS
jgi:MFS family permease